MSETNMPRRVSAVIRAYNNSDRYALGVSLLARSFESGRYRLAGSWPRQLGSLSKEQMLRLQDALIWPPMNALSKTPTVCVTVPPWCPCWKPFSSNAAKPTG